MFTHLGRVIFVLIVLQLLQSYGHEVVSNRTEAEVVEKYFAKLESVEKAHRKRSLQEIPAAAPAANLEGSFYHRLYENAKLMRTVLFEDSLRFSTAQYTVLGNADGNKRVDTVSHREMGGGRNQ